MRVDWRGRHSTGLNADDQTDQARFAEVFLPISSGEVLNSLSHFQDDCPSRMPTCHARTCPLWVISGHPTHWLGMSAFRPEPDLERRSAERPLCANSRRRAPRHPARCHRPPGGSALSARVA